MKNENQTENIFRKQTVPFTQVPNELLYNPNISFKAKGLWAYMSAKPDGWNFSADRIAEETKEERKSILAGLRELLANGYITAKRLSNGRMEYVLHWESAREPEPKEESARTPEPDSKPKSPDVVKESTSSEGEDRPTSRPKRSNYDTDKEYEKAFYKWNSV